MTSTRKMTEDSGLDVDRARDSLAAALFDAMRLRIACESAAETERELLRERLGAANANAARCEERLSYLERARVL